MTHEEHTLSAVLAGYHFNGTAKTENYIAPAFSSRRPMIKLAEQSAELGLFRVISLNAHFREAIQNSEFLFAQTLVDNERIRILAEPGSFGNDRRGILCSHVRRCKNHIRFAVRGQLGEPSAERGALLLTELRQRNVHVAHIEIDHLLA